MPAIAPEADQSSPPDDDRLTDAIDGADGEHLVRIGLENRAPGLAAHCGIDRGLPLLQVVEQLARCVHGASAVGIALVMDTASWTTLSPKAAEADAESKRLQGEGVANQRKAIVEGLRESVKQFQDATGVNATEVLRLVLLTQYFDTLKKIGVSAGSKVIMLPHAPAGMADIADQITKAIITGEEATNH